MKPPPGPSLLDLADAEPCPNCARLTDELAEYRRRDAEREARIRKETERDLCLFRRRLEEYPHVWREIERRLLGLHARGYRHYSIQAVFEQLRFHWSGSATVRPDDRGLKFPNSHCALFARMFVELHPACADLFTLNESKFDGLRPWADLLVEEAA